MVSDFSVVCGLVLIENAKILRSAAFSFVDYKVIDIHIKNATDAKFCKNNTISCHTAPNPVNGDWLHRPLLGLH